VSSVKDRSAVYSRSNVAAESEALIFDSSTLFERDMKRAFDVVLAIIGLILFSPIILLSSLAIKIESRGPIFDRQQRHSYNNNSLLVFRFRCTTTRNTCGAARANYKRLCVTRIGRILRSSGIERLPELVNVLRGDMSIVGPRPYATPSAACCEEQLSRISRHDAIKPGLTGWAQVHGCQNDSNSFRLMRRRIEYDLYYLEHWSLLLDIKIILMTLCSRRAYAGTERTSDR
jgi:lipopolysaccharide/colanic/teichoic acid biosynthesis glycosyltransferase